MAGTSWPQLTAGSRAKASDIELKFDWMEGHLYPMNSGTSADDTYDLGSSSFRWRRLFLGPGSLTEPSLSIRSSNIGLYSSAEGVLDFVISELSILKLDSSGKVTKPEHALFLAANTSTSIPSGGAGYIQFNSEIYDQTNDYNASTSVFTAAADGRYQFDVLLSVFSDVSGSTLTFTLYTSNRTYTLQTERATSGSQNFQLTFSVLADMDLGDTAYIYRNSIETMTVANVCYFGGYLVE